MRGYSGSARFFRVRETIKTATTLVYYLRFQSDPFDAHDKPEIHPLPKKKSRGLWAFSFIIPDSA